MQKPVQEKTALPDALYDLQMVERHVAPAFQFIGIETCMTGTQRHQMARFTRSHFVLFYRHCTINFISRWMRFFHPCEQ
jgi:hypothetical protein